MNTAFVFGLQLLSLRGGTVGEDLFESAKREVVNSEVDFPRSSHVLAPHCCAEFISGLMAVAENAVVRLDEGCGLVHGVFLHDCVVETVTGARRSADPDVFGE